MLIDSHCHLNLLDLTLYEGNLSFALKAAEEAGVNYFLSIGTNLEDSKSILATFANYKNVGVTVGVHPTETPSLEIQAQDIISLANKNLDLTLGIGETGLDFYRPEDVVQKPLQIKRFREHIIAAKELKKPLVIHSRMAGKETLKILKEEGADEVGGVFHCFTDSEEIAKEVLNMGFYIGATGIVTFPKATVLQNIVTKVPLDRLLLETDAPFLAPVPYRGKPNEPKYLPFIAEKIAQLKKESYETITEITSENFAKLFN